MNILQVNASKKYNVKTVESFFQIAEQFSTLKGKKFALVVDKNVYPLLKKEIEEGFLHFNLNVYTFIIENGESDKNLATVERIINFLVQNNFSRKDCLVAVGGGVTSDITAFVASIYLRKIDYFNIPTTLLSMVDSSIGGKTGVDYNGYKNIIGSFYQPSGVFILPRLIENFKTFPQNDGMAEVIKCGMIESSALLNYLSKENVNIEKLIFDCLSIKKKFVEIDEFDKNERQILNLGHTTAHAIEKLSNFKYTHGQAVGVGLLFSIKIALKLGVLKEDFSPFIESLLNKYNLITRVEFSLLDLVESIKKDKKSVGDSINLILPTAFGKSEIVNLSFEKLKEIGENL